ncbi:Protein of unknown function (DUF2819) [Frateuria aurantia DSM 6220]|uniref:Cellulose biosynthesis protein BcsE n=1 Tax=Frateuria aurantia (strain ATCC 33424 / DSM 6220 / KCTC 2777 / LMG 1558 / NBRC 3245 / NCIMB 13370) TaxID=767434 RepID=H8L5Y2_FRAAD|nr:Protein of unknown function (DUF2819) [Frateuria aurantia DSM 6220]
MSTFKPTSHEPVCLPLLGLQTEITAMHSTGLYWIHADSRATAMRLGLALIAAQSAAAQMLLIDNDALGRKIVEHLPAASGPARLDLWQLDAGKTSTIARWLVRDLDRILQQRPDLIVLSLNMTGPHVSDPAELATSLASLAGWLQARGCLMLVISHGQAAGLETRLFQMGHRVHGFAMLADRGNIYLYKLSYWCNRSGVFSQLEYALDWQSAETRFTLACGQPPQLPSSSTDQDQVLAMSPVMEGEPAPSSNWHLFEAFDALADQAMRAYSATLLLSVQQTDDIIPLARWLFQLRLSRGSHIKVVVREMATCLRYADEHLLLSAGTNLIIPFGASFGRVQTMIESVQGQLWPASPYRQVEELLEQYQPPSAAGLVSEAGFMLQLQKLRLGSPSQRLNHVLLRLQPKAGIDLETAIRQFTVKRRGDMICTSGDQAYLFLYACRANGIERALQNLFRLSWHDLFDRPESLDLTYFLEHGFSSAPEGRMPGHPGRKATNLPLTASTADNRPLPLRPRPMTTDSRGAL